MNALSKLFNQLRLVAIKLVKIMKYVFNFFGGHGHQRPKRKLKFNYCIGPTSDKQKAKMDIVINNEQKVKVTLNPVTGKGKPVALDGKPTWTVESGTCQVQPSEDGLSAEIISGDDPGDSVIVVAADADLGEGVVTVSDAIRVTVNGALASSLGLVAGTPEDK